MWRLNRIIAENLCAFRSLDYTLTQCVTTLVFGDNKDNESQRSNGSGKSALLEAIAVGITGSPMRKIKNEEIIRDDAEECWVCLTFSNDSSDELFTVERQLFRKGPSVVTCHIERGGQAIETDEAVQPSIDAYNRFILDKLGISREELYNNFLLSKYKYSDFLSSPDKEKKEVINRFSNGNLVDQAIAKLLEDQKPVEAAVRKSELEIAEVDGRIRMLEEQIETEENNHAARLRRKEEQIADLEKRIKEKRTLIRECQEESVLEKTSMEKQSVADTALQALENGDESLESCLKYITSEVLPLLPGKLTDWNAVLADKKLKLRDAETELQKWDKLSVESRESLVSVQKEYDSLSKKYQDAEVKNKQEQQACEERLKELDAELTNISQRLNEQKQQRRQLYTVIENLRDKLAGSIVCPACGHEFLTAERDFDVVAGKGLLSLQEEKAEGLTGKIAQNDRSLSEIEVSEEDVRRDKRRLTVCLREWSERLAAAEKALQESQRRQDSVSRSRQSTMDLIASLQEEMNGIRRRLFDEVFGLMDEAYRRHERNLQNGEESIKAAESAIRTLQEAISEYNHASPQDVVAGLRNSLRTYRTKAGEAMQQKNEIEKTLRTFQEQEQHFIQFKTYLANTKIEALAQVTNDFLENIGSDIRIRFSGYTVLKTGKVREKISISLLRDGMECGSFGKFSAGEAARVNLATILAMQTLVNGNCDGDKGLDLLVLDEILEAVDEAGLSSMFAALNRLGITALVVSHGNVAEGYPYKLLITKENGESKID
jgi:exonuclease SbcC